MRKRKTNEKGLPIERKGIEKVVIDYRCINKLLNLTEMEEQSVSSGMEVCENQCDNKKLQECDPIR